MTISVEQVTANETQQHNWNRSQQKNMKTSMEQVTANETQHQWDRSHPASETHQRQWNSQ